MSTKKPNVNLPENTVIQSDGMPRLTYGGFVGSANVDPRYAVKIKGKDVYVDVRDFFDVPVATRGNLRRNKASRLIRHTRRWSYAHQMAKQANIPMEDVIIIPNNEGEETVSGTVTDVDQHLIGVDFYKELPLFPTLVVQRVKKMCTVRVAYKKVVGGKYLYTSRIIDPLTCNLLWQNRTKIESWPIEKNGIEENNIQLEIPDSVVLANAPEWMRSDLAAYKNANGSLALRVPINGWWSKFKKGFMSVVRKVVNVAEKAIPIVKKVVKIAKMVIAPNGEAHCTLYQLDNLNDLIRYIQSRPGFPDSLRLNNVQKVLSPIAQGIITTNPEATGDAVAGNGYSMDDVEMIKCRNFTEFCRHEGYNSIGAMLEDAAANGNKRGVKYLFYGNIAHGLKKLWHAIPTPNDGAYRPANYGEEGDLPDEVDYRDENAVYPLDPADVDVASMDITGIGGKKLVSSVDTYHRPNIDVDTPTNMITLDSDVTKFETEYAVGNSIPRMLIWDIAPGFDGTADDVGKYLQFTEFDFDRISLYLEDENGFRVPCNSGAVSILNFDTTVVGKSSIATLKFVGQGGTIITAPFEYTVVDSPIVAMLSESIVKEVQIGTMFNPRWLINVVSDTPLDSTEPGFKNIGVLTKSGFTFEVEGATGEGVLRSEGDHKVTITSVNNPNIQSEVTITVRDFFRAPDPESGSGTRYLTVEEIRTRYRFNGWVDDDTDPTLEPGSAIAKNNVYFNIFDRITHVPIYSGRVIDFVTDLQHEGTQIFVNEKEITTTTSQTLDAGLNVFRIGGALLANGKMSVRFTKSYWYKPSQIKFDLKDSARYKLRYAVTENSVLNPDYSGYEATDFVLKLIRPTGDAVTITDFDIEVGSPFIYETDENGVVSKVGKCTIYPCNIKGLNPTVYGGARPGVEVAVSNSSSSPFTLTSVNILNANPSNDGYAPIKNTWLEKSLYATQYTYTNGSETFSVILDNATAWWDEIEGRADRYDNEVYFDNGTYVEIAAGIPETSSSTSLEDGVYGLLSAMQVKSQASFAGVSAIFRSTGASSITVPFGSVITPDMLKITSNEDMGIAEITNPIVIHNYYPLKVGDQRVYVQYGVKTTESSVRTYTTEVAVTVARPQIIDVKVQPNVTQYEHKQDFADTDISITGVTENNIEYAVPNADVSMPDFDTGGAEDQTGMASVQYPAEGTGITGTLAVASSKYNVGAGGGNTKFETPALVCRFSRPYAFVGDMNPDLGLEMAYTVWADGSRDMVDLEDVIIGHVDTDAEGTVEVAVTLRGDTWRSAAPRHRPSTKVAVTVKPKPAVEAAPVMKASAPKQAAAKTPAVSGEKVKSAVTGATIKAYNKLPTVEIPTEVEPPKAEPPKAEEPKQPADERPIYGEDQFWVR